MAPDHGAIRTRVHRRRKAPGCPRKAACRNGRGLEVVLDAETKNGKRLVQLGFMRRFDAQYQAMKQTILFRPDRRAADFPEWSPQPERAGLLHGE